MTAMHLGKYGEVLISVIMLTYNRQLLVSRAIESILNQTCADFEFIIIDNGSTDDSGKIADEYAKRDNRIKVRHKQRGNIGSGRNMGLGTAQGEYIAFVDDDDFAGPDFLEFLYDLAVNNNAEISICGATGREYDEVFVMNPEDALIKLLWRKYFNMQFPTKMIKRSLFENIRFSETAKYDDIELCPKIIAKAGKIVYHGLAKYTFDRGHGSNNSAWTTDHSLINAEILAEYLDVYKTRTIWLCSQYPGNSAIWRYFEWSFMISMIEKITRYDLVGCYFRRTELIDELNNHADEFVNSEYILDFEREWVERYVVNSK
jgi:glycosyltransferase involved in cell wall biosynthesis